jgi:hypothetical protein
MLSEKRISQALTLLDEGKIGIEIGVAQEDGEVVLKTVSYTISDSVKKQYASEFEHMVSELSKAADTDNKISQERQMSILSECIATMSGFSVSGSDAEGVNQAISLMNDALNALISYQE